MNMGYIFVRAMLGLQAKRACLYVCMCVCECLRVFSP